MYFKIIILKAVRQKIKQKGVFMKEASAKKIIKKTPQPQQEDQEWNSD